MKPDRHPKRTWFGDTPVRTLADAEHEAKQNSAPGLGAACKESTLHANRQPSQHGGVPVADPVASARQECEQQAKALFDDRLLQPEQLRAKYPKGWLCAPYVRCARLAQMRFCSEG
jgi:hypothetical protein